MAFTGVVELPGSGSSETTRFASAGGGGGGGVPPPLPPLDFEQAAIYRAKRTKTRGGQVS